MPYDFTKKLIPTLFVNRNLCILPSIQNDQASEPNCNMTSLLSTIQSNLLTTLHECQNNTHMQMQLLKDVYLHLNYMDAAARSLVSYYSDVETECTHRARLRYMIDRLIFSSFSLSLESPEYQIWFG